MKNKKSYGLNIGTSSVLIIIVILCLVCFSGLSVTSANADYRLSQKLADRTTDYYNSCNQAQINLLALSKELEITYLDSHDENDYNEKIKESLQDSLTFFYPINENQVLEVSINPLYPQTSSGNFFEINTWKISNLTTPDLDNSLPVLGSD